jgi:hypothetical protein
MAPHAQVLDFPLFVNDGGNALKNDLGVRLSTLHVIDGAFA